ncbi:MAG: competence/damage-inducible protein A [Nitrospiraceae bacterium]|nr:MAG: competence/damage-inducible protein A [Nitrospiraceae bacterium]
MENSKSAGIIIIGNEILSGKVHDVNSYFLACELRSLGVHLRRISVIPDEIETIGKEALEFSRKYDYVFTSGGVGPTHDDVTMAGIAKGFGVGLSLHPEIKGMLLARYKNVVNNAALKMAEVPEGAEIILDETMRFPVVLYKNIYIFPGIPEYLKTKFSLIRERFRSTAFYLTRIFLNAHESEFAEMLNSVVAENPAVQFGSYPVKGDQDYRVIVTAESKSGEALDRAVNELKGLLPGKIIVRIE